MAQARHTARRLADRSPAELVSLIDDDEGEREGQRRASLAAQPLNSLYLSLLGLVCALLLLLYVVDFGQRQMSNLFARFLAGSNAAAERRRRRSIATSLAAPGDELQTGQEAAAGQTRGSSPSALMQLQPGSSASLLQLDNLGAGSGARERRQPARHQSRSSLHSLLAALTGGGGASGTNGKPNPTLSCSTSNWCSRFLRPL